MSEKNLKKKQEEIVEPVTEKKAKKSSGNLDLG